MNTRISSPRFSGLGVWAVVALLALPCAAEGPDWWASGVINGTAANDYGLANQGQVKNIAHVAYQTMQARLGLCSSCLEPEWSAMMTMGGSLTPLDDYLLVNLGQLENTAKPFWDVLFKITDVPGGSGWPLYTTYPWGTGGGGNDYVAVNVGQVKNAFNFEIPWVTPTVHVGGGGGWLEWSCQGGGYYGPDGSSLSIPVVLRPSWCEGTFTLEVFGATFTRTIAGPVTLPGGSSTYSWNGLDDSGQPVAPGTYEILATWQVGTANYYGWNGASVWTTTMAITPDHAYACASCTVNCDVTFSILNGTFGAGGVNWQIAPSNIPGGATIVGTGNSATVTPGTVPNEYTITATSVTNPACQATASLTVMKVEIDTPAAFPAYVEVNKTTNMSSAVSPATALGGTYQWSKVSGPGTVTFGPSASAEDPMFSADAPGTYTVKVQYTKNGAMCDATSGDIVVLKVDLDIYRLEGNKVDEDRDDTEGSITRVLNPNDGETNGTGKAKGISLKLEPSIEPTGLSLTYKLRLKDIHTVANDKGLVRVYQDNGSGPVCIINNCPSASDTEEDLDESEFSDDFWMEFEGGGIMEFELVAFNGSTELCADAVRACAIGCQPRSGRILYVKSGGSGISPYDDYVDNPAASVSAALAIDAENDNVVVSSASYSESSLSIEKKISFGGLGLRWEANTELTTGWQTHAPYRPKFSLLPVIQPSTSSRVLEVAAGVSSVYFGSSVIKSGSQTGSGGAGLRAQGVTALGIYASQFSQNKTDKSGGAISFSPATGMSGLLLMQDCEVSDNEAFQGGAGVAAFDKGSVTFRRTRFSTNKTIRDDNDRATGGAFLAWASEGNWDIEQCIFNNNEVREKGTSVDSSWNVGGYGGAGVFAKGSPKVTVTDTEFRNNNALSAKNRGAGGAIAFGAGADISTPAMPYEATFKNCQFWGNRCGMTDVTANPTRSSGGAAYLLLAKACFEDCTFEGNRSFGQGVGPLPGPWSIGSAWGLLFKPDKIAYGGAIAGHMDSSIRLIHTTFRDNHADDTGGAIAIVGESEATTGETCCGFDITVQNIYLKECVLEQNSSQYHGGALCGASKKSGGTIDTCTFSKNVVGVDFSGTVLFAGPGRERNSSGTNILIDADGGAISYQAAIGSGLTVTDTKFEENRAYGGGGAIKHGGGANVVYTRCTLSGNKSLGDGGAIRVSTGANVSFGECKFDQNASGIDIGQGGNPGQSPEGIEGYGGSVSLDYAIVTMSTTTLQCAKAGTVTKPRNGGAIHVAAGSFGRKATPLFFLPIGGSIISPKLRVCGSSSLLDNTATAYGGALGSVISDTLLASVSIEFEECTVQGNVGNVVLQTPPPAVDSSDSAQTDPVTQGLYAPCILDNSVDAFYLVEDASAGSGNVTFKLFKTSVKAKNGSSGIAAYLEANLGHDELESTIQETTFDGFAIGVVSRFSDVKALDDCEFKYVVQNPSFPKDVIILDGKASGQKNEQEVRINRTKFGTHSGATGILVVRTQAAAGGLNIQAENNHFQGRQHASPPATAPIVHGNGGVVVLSRATSSVDASPNYWDNTGGPFAPGNSNPLGSYISRLVIYAPYLTTVPPGVGP